MRQVLVHRYYYFFWTQKHRIDGLTTLSISSTDIKKLYQSTELPFHTKYALLTSDFQHLIFFS